MELSEASAALVAISRGNSTANFDILNELIEKNVNLKKAYYTAEDREWQAQAMALPETTAEK